MPGISSFLSLTLPELNEFVNSWHTPVNQNFEAIDDWTSDLYQSLVGTSTTSTWANLRGSLASLATRLNVSINADGTIDLSSSAELSELAESKTEGVFSDTQARFEQNDLERFSARPGFSDSRFDISGPAIASSGDYPHAELDVAMAWRSRDFSPAQMHSPSMPWAPGLVSGPTTLLTSLADNQITFTVGSSPAVFNIDGYIFRLRRSVALDLASLTEISAGNYVWLFVERDEDSYNNVTTNFQYDDGAKDLRRLKEGTSNGTTLGTTFTSTEAGLNFETGIGKVEAGDLLVIDSGLAAGTYVVESITGAAELTVKTPFAADVGGLTWHIQDNAHPNLGGVITADANTLPTAVAGRVYVGHCQYGPGAVSNPVTFPHAGVWDSGWLQHATANLGADLGFDHNLGVTPSQVDIWVRDRTDATNTAYPPVIRREIDASSGIYYLVPSARISSTNLRTTLNFFGGAFFTNSVPADVDDDVDIRVIARR